MRKSVLEKTKDKLLEQKEIVNSLSSDESNSKEDEAVMIPMMELDTNEDTILEEANRDMLLLENLLEKSYSNWKLEPYVNNLCFNSFDEEMKYLERCIDKYEGVKYFISIDG